MASGLATHRGDVLQQLGEQPEAGRAHVAAVEAVAVAVDCHAAALVLRQAQHRVQPARRRRAKPARRARRA